MTNSIRTTTALPAAAALDCVEPRRRDIVRIAWWSLKAGRKIPSVVAILVGFFAFACFIFGAAFDWSPVPSLISAVVGTLVYIAAIWIAMAIRWLYVSRKHGQRVYLDKDRRAVIQLVEDRRKARWELSHHVAQRIGRGYGQKLRGDLKDPLREAAKAANVSIYGKAANKRVQSIYLQQFAAWGLRPHGKRGVIWSSDEGDN